MSATNSKLPRWFAVVGVAIGLGLFATSLYVEKYNPFHLPTTLEEARARGSYGEPTVLSVLEYAAVLLCPGLILEIPFSDTPGNVMPLVVWMAATAINGVLYYWLGRAIVALMRRLRRPGAGQKSSAEG